MKRTFLVDSAGLRKLLDDLNSGPEFASVSDPPMARAVSVIPGPGGKFLATVKWRHMHHLTAGDVASRYEVYEDGSSEKLKFDKPYFVEPITEWSSLDGYDQLDHYWGNRRYSTAYSLNILMDRPRIVKEAKK